MAVSAVGMEGRPLHELLDMDMVRSITCRAPDLLSSHEVDLAWAGFVSHAGPLLLFWMCATWSDYVLPTAYYCE